MWHRTTGAAGSAGAARNDGGAGQRDDTAVVGDGILPLGDECGGDAIVGQGGEVAVDDGEPVLHEGDDGVVLDLAYLREAEVELACTGEVSHGHSPCAGETEDDLCESVEGGAGLCLVCRDARDHEALVGNIGVDGRDVVLKCPEGGGACGHGIDDSLIGGVEREDHSIHVEVL